MKKLLIYILAGMLVLTTSCESELQTYSGDAGVYFAFEGTANVLQYSFFTTTEEYIDAELHVQTLGKPADRDRFFKLKVIETASTAVAGEDYNELTQAMCCIEAGKTETLVKLHLNYTPKLDNGSVRLYLELEPDSEFPAVMPSRRYATVIWTNLLVKPEVWDYVYADYFGSYSRVKHRYILAVLGWQELPDYMTESEKIAFGGILMNNYFKENEVLDENGNRIQPWLP